MGTAKNILLLVFALIFVHQRAFSQEWAEPEGGLDVVARAEKGALYFETRNGAFRWSFGGRFYFDAAAYFEDETDLGSGSELRDVGFYTKATLWDRWYTKINISFAGGKVAARDIFLRYKVSEHSFIRIGHFLEPFSIEGTTLSKEYKFLTAASTTEAFMPGYHLGASFRTYGRLLWFEGGVFGDGDLYNERSGDEGFALTGRLASRPMNEAGKLLHLGLSGSYRIADANGYDANGDDARNRYFRFRSRAETHVEGTRFIDTGNLMDADYAAKYGVELIGIASTFSLQAEYMGVAVERKDGLAGRSFYGLYAQLGWLIRGGSYTYATPYARFSQPGPGSLELLVRYNNTNLNHQVEAVDGIAGGEAHDYSVGLNWYVNHNLRLMLNYVMVNNDQYAGDETFSFIQTRVQIAF